MLNAYAVKRELYGRGRPMKQAVGRLLSREYWSRKQIRDYQDERIREVVRVAYAGSPYYQAVMNEAALKPVDIRGAEDLHKLPLLTRSVLRSRSSELWTARHPQRGWLHGHTSGTTGTPLNMWYDRQTCVENNAQDWRQKTWGGMQTADWIGMFLGRVIVSPEQKAAPYWRVNRVQREVWFSSFHMSERTLDSYVAEIRRRRLRFLEGYPSTLFILATHVRRSGRVLPMKAVFTSSETLHPIQREVIQSAFDCPLFDFYGMAERTVFASECEEHSGRHLAEDFGYTEVVDDAGAPVAAGGWGYVVGTSLHNTAMPMIRYLTSDVSRVLEAPCPCGRTSRVLDPVTTKAEDVVITPDGRIISPSVLTHPFKPLHQLVKSQIIQLETDRVLVKLVAGGEFTEVHERELVSGLRARLGSDMRIDIEMVDDIPPERSGKFRWVISRVATPYSPPWDRMDRQAPAVSLS